MLKTGSSTLEPRSAQDCDEDPPLPGGEDDRPTSQTWIVP